MASVQATTLCRNARLTVQSATPQASPGLAPGARFTFVRDSLGNVRTMPKRSAGSARIAAKKPAEEALSSAMKAMGVAKKAMKKAKKANAKAKAAHIAARRAAQLNGASGSARETTKDDEETPVVTKAATTRATKKAATTRADQEGRHHPRHQEGRHHPRHQEGRHHPRHQEGRHHPRHQEGRHHPRHQEGRHHPRTKKAATTRATRRPPPPAPPRRPPPPAPPRRPPPPARERAQVLPPDPSGARCRAGVKSSPNTTQPPMSALHRALGGVATRNNPRHRVLHPDRTGSPDGATTCVDLARSGCRGLGGDHVHGSPTPNQRPRQGPGRGSGCRVRPLATRG